MTVSRTSFESVSGRNGLRVQLISFDAIRNIRKEPKLTSSRSCFHFQVPAMILFPESVGTLVWASAASRGEQEPTASTIVQVYSSTCSSFPNSRQDSLLSHSQSAMVLGICRPSHLQRHIGASGDEEEYDHDLDLLPDFFIQCSGMSLTEERSAGVTSTR